MTSPAVLVNPNVTGDIIIGDNNFKLNNNYGTIIYKQAAPRVRLRTAVPQPPRKPRDFVGRNPELAQLEKHIAANEAVAIYGPNGYGKTTLLKQAANGVAARALPNGVLLLEAIRTDAPAPGLDDLAQQCFDALYESEPTLKVTATTARTYLSNNRPLVVLDDLTLPAASLTALADLFPQGALLFTQSVAPTGDAAVPFKLAPLSRADSISLLVSRLSLEDSDANRADLDAICNLLGDIPLALVTAANTMRERELHLPQSRETLAAITNPDPIAKAYEFTRLNLTAAERSLVAIAANTPSISVDPEWLRTAANDPPNFDGTLYSLQSRELLVANSPRLRLAPGLKTLSRLNPADRNDLMQRLAQYLLERLLIHETDFDYFADELGNILAAIDWAIQQGLWTLAFNLGQAVDPFLLFKGKWDSWQTVLEHCLTAARGKGDRAAEAWALHQLGTHAIGVGANAQASTLLNQALTIRQSLGDTVAAAYTQHNLNFIVPPAPPPPRGNINPPKPPMGPGFGPALAFIVAGGGLGLITLFGLILAASFILNGNRTVTPPTPISIVRPTVIAPVVTLTPTHTQTPTPTFTATPTDTPTATPTATPAPLIFFVTTQDDLPDTNPGDGLCEYKPGLCSLRAAIIEANQQSAPVEIILSSGTYDLKIGGNDDASAQGDLDLSRTVTIKGAGADVTFVTGLGLDGTDRLMQILSGADVTLQSLTLDGGNAKQGGGLLIEKGATLTTDSVVITGNTATNGGGLSNAGDLHLNQSVISGNVAVTCGGGLENSGQAVLTNVTLFQNSVVPPAGVEFSQPVGGGICNSGELRLESVTVSDNFNQGQNIGANLFNDDTSNGVIAVHNTLVVNGSCTGKIVSRGFNLAGANTTECIKRFQAKGDFQTDQAIVDLTLNDNGGHIPSLALIAESPALNAGDPADCPPIDGRGLPRTDPRCDIGAYEAP